MFDIEVFIIEAVAKDRDGAPAVSSDDIAALDHEVGNDPMETGAPVRAAIHSARRQRHEVSHRSVGRSSSQVFGRGKITYRGTCFPKRTIVTDPRGC